jgi:hypothetical protein
MATKKAYLTQKQKQAIQLALEGRKWKDIAETLEITENTLWVWRQDPLFQTQLTVSQEAMLNETSLLFNTYVSAGFATLYRIATNKDKSYSAKLEYDAGCKLVELPFANIEKLKIIEHNRRELRLEDATQEDTTLEDADNQIPE